MALLIQGSSVFLRRICNRYSTGILPYCSIFSSCRRSDAYIAKKAIREKQLSETNIMRQMSVRKLSSEVGIDINTSSQSSNISSKSESVDSLINLLNERVIDQFTPEQVWYTLKTLLHSHYQHLHGQIPWLQSNLHIAYIQLFLRNSVSEMASDILRHKNFILLWESLLDKSDQLTDAQLAECLMVGLYLGVEQDSKTFHKILIQLRKRAKGFDTEALMISSNVIKALPGFDFFLIRQIVNRLCEIINIRDPESVSSIESLAIINTASNVLKFLTSEATNKLYSWLLRYFEREDIILSADHFGAFLRLCKYTLKQDPFIIEPFKEIIVKTCKRVIPDANAGHIAEICGSLKLCRLFESGIIANLAENEIAELAETRALELLNDDLKLCDISNLMFALTKSTPKKVSMRFQGALHSRLARAPDIDSIVLSNIADVLLDIGDVSRDVIALVQRRISNQANEIISHVTRFNKIMRLLVQKRFIDQEDEMRFVTSLLSHLDGFGVRRHSIPFVTQFLLTSSSYHQSTSGGLPTEVVRQLTEVLPDLREHELTRLVICANSVKIPHNSVLRHQLSQILGSAQVNLINKLDRIDSLQRLLQLMYGLIVNNRQRDPTLCDLLFQAFPQFISEMNKSHLRRVIEVFNSAPYHLPLIYEQLADFLIHNQSEVDDYRQMKIFEIFAVVGHVPKNSLALMDVASGLYKRLHDKRELSSALRLLVNLSAIQMYPDNILSKLFTLEEIQDIEGYSKEKQKYRESIERDMMELNRAVVLECPQLDVPWFHEDYCLSNIAHEAMDGKQSADMKKFRSEVEQAAMEVLGDSRYMRCSVHSPYYHKIDIECALGSNKKPVKMNKLKGVDYEKSKLQRIAICILPESSYCYNSKQLIGAEQVRKRHLEIVEYKYVEISYSDWYSMGLSEWSTKVEYLRSKIMN